MVSVSHSREMGGVPNGFNPSLSCVFCKNYLFNQPRQLPCGDRICGECFQRLLSADDSSGKQNSTSSPCPLCGGEVDLAQCFRDKAVEMELAGTVIKCTNSGCPWEGESKYFNEHHQNCKFTTIECPNVGCEEEIYKNGLEDHLSVCRYSPVSCEWCGEKIDLQDKENHLKTECREVFVSCINGCGEKCLRKELPQHLAETCTVEVRDCEYQEHGCQFKGNFQELSKHETERTSYHLQLINSALQKSNKELRKEVNADSRIQALDTKVAAVRDDIAKIRGELSQQIQPLVEAVMKSETAIQQLHEGFTELALMVQTMQATSYNGNFVWKINEVQRRIQEAKSSKVISLYSAPFYTSRYGYKLCLRLYMDGDGSGKGTHLSFFLTIMRGEYDALLTWPFRQSVTLALINQDKQRDIVQSFRPEPSSSSFQRPRKEMNVASGCPMFAPVSVLNNPSFVKDDCMFLRCQISTVGLENR